MSTDRSDSLLGGDASTELSSNRTSLSFERTRMGSDRTLMATVRTSLSLISFGFTIYQLFQKLPGLEGAHLGGRRLGMALLLLGVGFLVMGLISHSLFDRALAERRQRLHDLGLLRRGGQYHATPTYLTALLLLAIGLLAIAAITFRLL